MNEPKPQFSVISAAFDKDEFFLVYQLLFASTEIRTESLQAAFEYLSIWNARLNVGNGELKATEILVQVMLRDRLANPCDTTNLICSGYSMALTRFLNNLCNEKYWNFRNAVAAMGLESFVVDIRNIGNHLENYASIDLYRRVANYCLGWLKEVFWDEQLKSMQNVEIGSVQPRTPSKNEENLQNLLLVYDTLVEVLEKHGIRSTRLLHTIDLPLHKLKALNGFAKFRQDESLNNLFRGLLTELQFIIMQADVEDVLTNLTELFTATCEHFFASKGIKYYQPLIRLFIRGRQLEKFCEKLLEICESNKESNEKRSGALYWLEAILDSLNKFKHLKDIPLDDNFANDNCRSVVNAYKKELSVDIENFLIIGDMYQRPWKLEFRQPYLIKRLDFLCEFTKPIIVRLLKLASPAFSAQEVNDVEKQLEEYYTNTEQRLKRKSIVLPKVDDAKRRKFGVWNCDSVMNWEKYPLGAKITSDG